MFSSSILESYIDVSIFEMDKFPEYPKILKFGEHLNVWLAKKQGSFQAKSHFHYWTFRLRVDSMKIHWCPGWGQFF